MRKNSVLQAASLIYLLFKRKTKETYYCFSVLPPKITHFNLHLTNMWVTKCSNLSHHAPFLTFSGFTVPQGKTLSPCLISRREGTPIRKDWEQILFTLTHKWGLVTLLGSDGWTVRALHTLLIIRSVKYFDPSFNIAGDTPGTFSRPARTHFA